MMETEKLDLNSPLPVINNNVKKEVTFANKVLSGRKKGDDVGKDSEELVDVSKILAKPKIEPVTEEYMSAISPRKLSKKALKVATDMMNQAIEGMDDGLGVHFRDQCIDLIGCLRGESVHSLQQYYSAVKFLVHRMAGDSLVRAYTKTFPDRVAEMHIMYHDYFHMAVKTQVEIMTDTTVSPKVRSDAANSLMTHLKAPEVAKAELEVKVEDNSVVEQLKGALFSLASQQKKMIDLGEASVIEVSKEKIYAEGDDNEPSKENS